VIQRWDGTDWSTVASPTPPGDLPAWSLQGVSCPSPTNCFAIGSSGTYAIGRESNTKTLVEHWNGSRWSILPSPNPSQPEQAALFGVSCPSTTVCMAVGDHYTSTDLDFVFRTLAEAYA
jgi:hypothetical protein